jgi:hypothetical protein
MNDADFEYRRIVDPVESGTLEAWQMVKKKAPAGQAPLID